MKRDDCIYKDIISGIYCIENKINHKKYIGQSVNIYQRRNQHKNELLRNCHDNDYLQKSFNKYGLDNFEFYILEECTPENLDKREIYYINHYHTLDDNYGYNLKAGGQDGEVTEYGNIKKSNSLKETYQNSDLREIRRQDALRQWSNPEVKAKITGKNNGMYGRKHSDEAKAKMSNARKGSVSPFRNPTPVLCIELNHIFSCASEAEKQLNISTRILEVCKGNRKTAGGYHWQFYYGK